MPTPLRARTKTACSIARLNSDRFNEAVHAGSFPCAPKTIAGKVRVFDVNDIIALRVYAQLLEESMSANVAGHQACGLRDLLREHPETERAVHVVFAVGSNRWMLRTDLPDDAERVSGSTIVAVREWRLRQLRLAIEAELAEEAGVVGDA